MTNCYSKLSTSEATQEIIVSKRSVFDLIPADRGHRGQMRMLRMGSRNAKMRTEDRKERRMRSKDQLRLLFKRWMKRSEEKTHFVIQ